MATLSAEDVANLRQLAVRVAEMDRRLGAAETQVSATNTSANALVAALREEFTRMGEAFSALQLETQELREAVEAVRGGRAGAAGTYLLDPKFLEKPGKFAGVQSEWKDWSEAMQAFCDVADVTLGAAMKRYARCEEVTLLTEMSEDDRKHSTKLWALQRGSCPEEENHR